MQVMCIKAFGVSVPGDVAEVPDGAAVDPEHWQPVTAATDEVFDAMKAKVDELDDPPAPRPAPSLLSAVTVTPKEGM
jgi:hypothetical protein